MSSPSTARPAPSPRSRRREELRQRRRPDRVDPRRRLPRVRARRAGEALMSAAAWGQLLLLIALLAVSTPLLGRYLAKVFDGGVKAPGDRVFEPVDRVIYRAPGGNPDSEQPWTTYAYSLLAFSLVSVL